MFDLGSACLAANLEFPAPQASAMRRDIILTIAFQYNQDLPFEGVKY